MANPALGDEMRKLVRRQIKANEPPITRATYQRLMDEIEDEDEVIRMLACALLTETHTMMKRQEPFDLKRFTGILEQLPDESYLDEED